jgi:hypothetical protein
MQPRICKNCGYKGEPKMPGSGYIEIALYFLYVVPGLLYSIWRRQGTSQNICPACNSPHMIGLESPAARDVSSNHQPVAATQITQPVPLPPKKMNAFIKAFLFILALGFILPVIGMLSQGASSPAPIPALPTAVQNAVIQKTKLQQEALLAKLHKKTDKMEGITWYMDKTSPQNNDTNAFFLYFGVQNGNPFLPRLKVQYEGSSWLFIDSFFVVADGRRFDKSYAHFERGSNTNIWEWYDDSMDEADRAMIEAIIRSKEATIRFVGAQYHADKKISAVQKEALKNVLAAYDALSANK